MEPRVIQLTVNGREHRVAVEPNAVLLHTLREIGYTDVKNGCEIGECGACAVLLDGESVNSCMVLAWQADGAQITTNSGLGTMDRPHIIQEAFADTGAIQCGFCTPGMIISTKNLLDRNPDPTEDEIRDALSGNLCRCTGYGQIVSAVKLAAERLRDLGSYLGSSQSEERRESDSPNRIPVGSEHSSSSSSHSEARRESASSLREEVQESDSVGRIPADGETRKDGSSAGTDTGMAPKGGCHA